MKITDFAVALIFLAGGMLIGSGLGAYLDYPQFSFITNMGLPSSSHLKDGAVLIVLGTMGHIVLGSSLRP